MDEQTLKRITRSYPSKRLTQFLSQLIHPFLFLIYRNGLFSYSEDLDYCQMIMSCSKLYKSFSYAVARESRVQASSLESASAAFGQAPRHQLTHF